MSKRFGEKFSDGRCHCPAAERNKGPILAVLKQFLPHTGLVLEIASGTGQHIAHFAAAMPELTWQPTDPDAQLRESILLRTQAIELANVNPPLDLDVLRLPWPISRADAIVCINMIHVAPWTATKALCDGAGQVLDNGGMLFLYGPYRRGGRHTAPSNEAFDASLRARNPQWGLRDLEDVARHAEDGGFDLAEITEMPANNLSLIFRKRSAAHD